MLALGLALALGSAAALNWGYLAQHGAAVAMPPLSPRRPLRSLALLFSHRRWLAGFLVGIGGWGLYVVALALAPLSLVQAVSAGGIGLLALLVARGGTVLARREWTGVALGLGGLALLGVSLGGGGTHGRHASWLALALWLGGSAVVAALACARGGGVGFGAAAGVLYAAGDVVTKAAVGGGAHLALAPALLACHGLAFVCLQLGFQRGGALGTIGVATLLTNALPIAAGTTLYGEGLPAGPLGVVRVAAFVCTVAGAVALARGEGEPAAARRAQPLALTD